MKLSNLSSTAITLIPWVCLLHTNSSVAENLLTSRVSALAKKPFTLCMRSLNTVCTRCIGEKGNCHMICASFDLLFNRRKKAYSSRKSPFVYYYDSYILRRLISYFASPGSILKIVCPPYSMRTNRTLSSSYILCPLGYYDSIIIVQ